MFLWLPHVTLLWLGTPSWRIEGTLGRYLNQNHVLPHSPESKFSIPLFVFTVKIYQNCLVSERKCILGEVWSLKVQDIKTYFRDGFSDDVLRTDQLSRSQWSMLCCYSEDTRCCLPFLVLSNIDMIPLLTNLHVLGVLFNKIQKILKNLLQFSPIYIELYHCS